MYISLYISQKSSGNGKDLLQMHVSTRWVGRNHTPVRRYNTCAVTQIGVVGVAHALPVTDVHIVPVDCDLTAHNLLILPTPDVALVLG